MNNITSYLPLHSSADLSRVYDKDKKTSDGIEDVSVVRGSLTLTPICIDNPSRIAQDSSITEALQSAHIWRT